MTLRRKILIGYSAVLLLMIIMLVSAFVSLHDLGRGILKGNYMSMICADNMVAAIERQNDAIFLMILGHTDEGFKQFKDNEKLFLQWLAEEKNYITEIGESDTVRDIEMKYSLYLTKFSMLKDLYQTDSQKLARLYYETMLPSFQAVRNSCTNLREINQNALFKVTDLAQFITTRAVWSMILTGIVAVGIGLWLSLLLSNLIAKPLRQIVEAVQEVASGDYDIEIPGESSDELGYLASEFNVMIGKLKEFQALNIKQVLAEKQKNDAIIRNIDDGFLLIDNKLKIVSMNPAAAKIFDVELDEMQGKHISKVVKDDSLLSYVDHLVKPEQPNLIEEGRNVIKVMQGETLRYYMFSITPVYADDADSTAWEMVLLLRDVTRMEELDHLKDEFIMTASHELITPLTSIGMGIEILQENAMQKLSEKEQQILSVTHEEARRLKNLVNDLLDLSKIETGKINMEFDRVPVLSLFDKIAETFKPQADGKAIAFSYKIDGESFNVKADAAKITLVLTNLISNALRYTNSGGYIHLFAERINTKVNISVSDNGKGIPYEYQSRIFDKFVQIKSDMNRGSGLGLSICKEIVRAHGGNIWVESTPDKGSIFTFTLPVYENLL